MKEEQQEQMWTADQKHLEKEERLKALKDDQGYKKPLRIKGQSPYVKVLSLVLAVAIVLGVSIWASFALGIPQRYITLATVGQEKVSIVDYNYTYNAVYNMYNNYASQGFMPATAQGTLDLDALSPFEKDGKKYTYGEYITYVAHEELQNIKLMLGLAKKEGFTLPEDKEEDIEKSIQNAETQLGGSLQLENVLVNLLGPGASREEYKRLLRENALVSLYTAHVQAGYTFTNEELQAEYEAHRDQYDLVDYREFVFYPELLSETEKKLSEAEQKKLLEEKNQALEEQVNNFVALVKDEKSFKAQVLAFSPEDEKEQNAGDHVTLRRGLSKKALPTQEVGDWMYEASRKKNDVRIFDAGTGKRVVLFLNRYRSEERLSEVGILVLPTNVAVTEENKDAVEKALSALEQKALALAPSITDEASLKKATDTLKEEGQTAHMLWQANASKANLPVEVAQWAFDASRKVGDYRVIKNKDGQASVSLYVYGGAKDYIAWQNTVSEALKAQKYDKMMEDLKALPENQVLVNSFWLRFTSRLAVGTKNGDDVAAKQEQASESSASESKASE